MKTVKTDFIYNFYMQHTAELIIFIMLYLISLMLIYLKTGSLYLLITFLQFPLCPTPPLLVTTNLFFYELVHLFVLKHN